MEAIANGPLSTLIALMAIPFISVVLIVGFLFFSMSRRRKKSQMKHGLGIGSLATEDQTDAAGAEMATIEETNSRPPPTAQPVSTDNASDLDLGILTAPNEVEPTMNENLESAHEQPLDLASRLDSALPESSRPPQSSEPVELLRLLRDPVSGQLLVEIAGQRYAKLADITDRRIGQYILQVTAHLLAFTNGRIVTDAGMKSVYNPRVKEAPLPIDGSAPSTPSPSAGTPAEETKEMPREEVPEDSPPSLVPKPPPEAEAAFLSSLETLPKEPDPTPQRGGLFRRAPKPAQTETAIPTLNLAEEINDIVQARLRYSSLAENNRIEITGDYSGGIRIRVNDEFYNSPEEIPNPEVKELIQASIKEWERS